VISAADTWPTETRNRPSAPGRAGRRLVRSSTVPVGSSSSSTLMAVAPPAPLATRSHSHKHTAQIAKGGLPHFHAWCVQKFGSLVRLWRCLDVHQTMKVGQSQFLKKLQELGYSGDARDLFKVMNRDQTGTLLFYHFDPGAALRVAELLSWAREHFGGLKGVGLMTSINQTSRITKRAFFKLIRDKGFADEEAIRSAFDLVDKDGDGTVNRCEAMTLDTWDFPEWLTVQPDERAAEACKAKMLKKYQGNALLVWRHLDRNNTMRVSWYDFQQVCRKMLPAEDCHRLPAVWRAMDMDLSGWLSLREFDDEAYSWLTRFCQWAQKQFGSVAAAFPKLTASSEGRIGHSEFRSICKHSGLGDAIVSAIFAGLDVDCTGNISMSEIRFLDQWKLSEDIKEEEAWGSLILSKCEQGVQRRESEAVTGEA